MSQNRDDPSQASVQLAVQLSDLPDSPCVGICTTLFDDVCQGCGRTMAEVSQWIFFSDEEKLAVWRRLIAAGLVQPRRGK